MTVIPEGKKLIIFDGVCNLCNSSVLKIIKYDKKNIFLFAPLQSEIANKITEQLKIDTNKVDSIILYEPNVSYDLKSTAVLKIMKDFGGFWSITQIFMLFPEAFRNHIYNFIAKNRYKWFGKKESCIIPTPQLKVKFLS